MYIYFALFAILLAFITADLNNLKFFIFVMSFLLHFKYFKAFVQYDQTVGTVNHCYIAKLAALVLLTGSCGLC